MHTMEAVDIENHEGKKGGKISTYKLEGAGPCFANNPKVVAFLMRRNFACSNGSEAASCWARVSAVPCWTGAGGVWLQSTAMTKAARSSRVLARVPFLGGRLPRACARHRTAFSLSINTHLPLRSRSSIQSVIRKPYSSFSQPNITSSSSQSAVEPPPSATTTASAKYKTTYKSITQMIKHEQLIPLKHPPPRNQESVVSRASRRVPTSEHEFLQDQA
jgi:hypothetical protein